MRRLLVFFASVTLLVGCAPSPKKKRPPPSSSLQIHALLVAGSNGIENYRHQADIAHSYALLRAKGVPAENIVVMMFDDVASHPQNPTPGELRNAPKGPDYYKGLNIDYRNTDVNVDNFVAVLTGNAKEVRGGHNNGRVLRNSKQDNIFLVLVDHGAPGLIGMPSGRSLTKSVLQNAIKKASFNQLSVYIESCESGSMLAGMENAENVFGLAASTASEPSYSCNCEKGFCFGDAFSVEWMADSEKHNLNTLNLENQFSDVKKEVKHSTVCRFGNAALNPYPVSHFQGEKGGTYSYSEEFNLDGEEATIPARDVPLYFYRYLAENSSTLEKRKEAQQEFDEIIRKRKLADGIFETFQQIGVKIPQGQFESDPDCYEKLILTFEEECQTLGQSPYLAGKLGKWEKLTEKRDCGVLLAELSAFCREDFIMHRKIFFV